MPTAQAHPETAQMMIINPLAGLDVGELFRTHPHTEERIARLHAMARGVG
jgi:heat shock protein HtpX